MSAVPRFTSAEPESELKPFVITGWRWEDDDGDSAGERVRVEVEETFHCRTDVSYGLILRELDAIEGGGSPYGVFRTVLADPDGSEPEDGSNPEADRFERFVASDDVFVARGALIGALRWIAGEQAERPTGSPSGSRSTRRAGGRGSGGTRRR